MTDSVARVLRGVCVLAGLVMGGAAAPFNCVAQSGSGGIFFEQDFLYPPKNEDRNYTMGLGIHAAGPWVTSSGINGPLHLTDRGFDWLYAHAITRLTKSAFSIRYPQNDTTYVFESVMLAGTAFSPDSLAAYEPIVGDRPYAFLLGWTARRMTLPANKKYAWSSDLTLGMLGTYLGRNVQRYIHKKARGCCDETPRDPKGWSNQISNGGEPTLRYSLSYERELPLTVEARLGKVFQATVGGSGNVGYYNEIDGAATARLGLFQSEFWQFRSSPLGGSNKAPSESKLSPLEIFVFGSVRPRLVAYNVMLQGQFRRNPNSPTIPARDIEREVFESDLGAAGMLRIHGHGAGVVVNYPAKRTREFRGPYARDHYWGALLLTIF